MARVSKAERYVLVAYELLCGYERAEALAQDLMRELKTDSGLDSAKDDTRCWDGPKHAVVLVTYCTLADALRLDPEVRRLLSRKVNFTYDARTHVSYGQRGASAYVRATTTIEPR